MVGIANRLKGALRGIPSTADLPFGIHVLCASLAAHAWFAAFLPFLRGTANKSTEG
jgi:hypothetical protein